MKTLKTSNFKDISDLFSYKYYKVKIDYDKKILTYDCSVYGNDQSSKFSKEIETLIEDVDSMFKKNLIISLSNLYSLLSSKTHGKYVLRDIKSKVLNKIPFFYFKDSKDEFLNEITENTLEDLLNQIKITDRTKDFKARALKTGKIPKILKPVKSNIDLTFEEYCKLSKEDFKNICKYFRAQNSTGYRRTTLTHTILTINAPKKEFFDNALKLGFSVSEFENLEYYKNLKTVSIFNEIGA